MLTRNHIAAILALFSVCNTQAQTLQLDPAVRTGKLPNGFTYYIRHNTEPKNRVVMYLANKIGSMQEDNDQLGLAHFMEHMSFNGTKHYPKNQLVDYLQKAGVRFGADINAYTGFDETVYQLPLPSDDTSIVRHGLQIMRDWAGEATLESSEIEKERGVVLEEKRLRTGAQHRLMAQYWGMQMNNSRYAERMPIGTEKVLTTFKPEAIKRFYRDWYRPDLQGLIVVGDIDVDFMEKQIRRMFGDLRGPAGLRERISYVIPLSGSNQFIALTDPEQTSTSIQVIVKQPSLGLKTRANYRAAIIRNLFNGVLAERLSSRSQEANVPFVQAQAGVGEFMGGLDAFSVNVVVKPGLMRESFFAVWSMVEQFKKFGVTASELERQKIGYLKQMQVMMQEKNKTPSSSYVNEYLQYFLKGVAAPGIDEEFRMVQEDLGSITVAEVNTAVSRAIRDINRDVIILAPEKERGSLPDEKRFISWMKNISDSSIGAYVDGGRPDVLMPVLPVKGSIISKTYEVKTGVIQLRLSNGASVFVKPTDFKNDEIIFSAFSPGGTSLYGDSVYQSAASAAQIMAAGGVGAFSTVELGKMLTGKSVNVTPSIADRFEGVNGAFVPSDAETAMQLMHLYFTSPRADTGVFQNIISRSRVAIENRSNDPATVFADTVSAVLGSYNYRRMPPSVSRLAEVRLDKIRSIYRERFADAGDFSFVFVGNIDTVRLFALVEQYIASLPSGGVAEKARDLGIRMPAGVVSRTVHAGSENKANVRLVFSGDYTFSDSNNILLTALGSVLQYRITERIRETEGGAYTPQAGVNYVKYPSSRYAFTIAFTCAPSNVERLVVAANEEIARLREVGPPEDDVVKFIAEETRAYETQMRSNQFWLQYMSYALQNSLEIDSVFGLGDRLKVVSSASLRDAARKYLSGGNYIRLVHLPEE